MASRFTKAFRFISLVLVFTVAQVYVIASPIKVSTEPGSAGKKSESVMPNSSSKVTSEVVSSEEQSAKAEAASERMPLTAGTKTALKRIFSRHDMEMRAAAGNTFLNARTSASEMFKSPVRSSAVPQNDDSDSGGGGSRGTWIAVGVIAAVLTIAVIGLRMDRNRGH